jgi:hypothetical protein
MNRDMVGADHITPEFDFSLQPLQTQSRVMRWRFREQFLRVRLPG